VFMKTTKIVQEKYQKASFQIDSAWSRLESFIRQNLSLVICLLIVTVVVYGFELFNFNLTIDEEVHATFTGPTTDWLMQGRWGMYVLNRILLPFSVIPFVPLSLALLFHISAIVLLVNIWGNQSRLEKIITGTICLAYPGIAYVYTFSTINYGIGFGFLCCALSLWLFVKQRDSKWYYAIIPATFATSIYQGMIPAIIAVFLVYFIFLFLTESTPTGKKVGKFIIVILAAIILSQLIQLILIKLTSLTESSYVSNYFNFQAITENAWQILKNLLHTMVQVYTGDKTIYSLQIWALELLLILSAVGFITKIFLSKVSNPRKLTAFLLYVALIMTPFLSGVLMNGYYAMRFLVALSFVIPGIIALGVSIKSSPYRLLLSIAAVFCLLQFAMTTNHLFGSSHLALQSDRLLGERLIERIDQAMDEVNRQGAVKYIEIIGYYDYPESDLIVEKETFGASFFQWDEGNVWRVIMFLDTLGYDQLTALPSGRRSSFINVATAMPDWPADGSVKVEEDTVILKFGPYSNLQKFSICNIMLDQGGLYQNLEECEKSLFVN